MPPAQQQQQQQQQQRPSAPAPALQVVERAHRTVCLGGTSQLQRSRRLRTQPLKRNQTAWSPRGPLSHHRPRNPPTALCRMAPTSVPPAQPAQSAVTSTHPAQSSALALAPAPGAELHCIGCGSGSPLASLPTAPPLATLLKYKHHLLREDQTRTRIVSLATKSFI